MKNALIINHNAHLAIIVLSFACLTAPAQDYRVLHHFAGGANDGSGPLESLIRSGSFLYGMTLNGGGNNNGVVFRISTVGTDFSLLHSFDGPNGRCPNASLTQSGSTLFGMTWRGGTSDNGTIFRINTDGAGFLLLHRFAGGSSDGYGPADSPILSGSTLFGNTHLGGAGGNGVVYRINTDGTGYQLLHSFGSAGNDGQRPIGSLLQSGSILYGTTVGGGSSSLGTVYKINTNGTGFQLLHSFSGGSNDGKGPDGLLIQSSSTLYGITGSGGSNDLGTIFRINPGGGGFQVIHSFVGGTGDGSQPLKGSLVQSGSTLYGMAYGGGAGNNGVVFQIDTNGNNFKLLHSFTGADGSKPSGSMVLSDSTLYGMASQGGSNNLGVIFALDLAQARDLAGRHQCQSCLEHELSGLRAGKHRPVGRCLDTRARCDRIFRHAAGKCRKPILPAQKENGERIRSTDSFVRRHMGRRHDRQPWLSMSLTGAVQTPPLGRVKRTRSFFAVFPSWAVTNR